MCAVGKLGRSPICVDSGESIALLGGDNVDETWLGEKRVKNHDFVPRNA
jgi:hypothetical protein